MSDIAAQAHEEDPTLEPPLNGRATAEVSSSSDPLAVHIPDFVPLQEQHLSVPAPNYPTGTRFYLICLALALVLTLSGLDGNIVATAVPAISAHFGTIADVGWYAAAYRLCSCATQLLFGKLYKIFSTKGVLAATIMVFFLGSVCCAAATTSVMFVLGRAISGVGFAGINAGCLSVATQILPLRKRPFFNGVMAGVESIAVITAPILGGVLTERLSWRFCFWLNLPVGAAALAGIIFALPTQRSRLGSMSWSAIVKELDLLGNIVIVPCLTSLFIALTWAGTKYPWNSPKIIGCLVAFLGLLAVFAYDLYRRQENAILPPRILRNRNVIAGFIFAACTNGSEAVVEYYLPSYFQWVRGYSPSESGYFMAPILVGFLIGLLIQGGGTTIVGYYSPFMLMASTLMPVAAGLVTTWTPETPLIKILVLTGFFGLSTGIGFQSPQSAVQTTLPDADTSTGLAIILFAQGFGPAVFLAAAQSIFVNRLAVNLHDLAPSVNATAVASTGFGQWKGNSTKGEQGDMVLAFDRSLAQTWYLTVGSSSLTMIGSLLMDWQSVKTKRA